MASVPYDHPVSFSCCMEYHAAVHSAGIGLLKIFVQLIVAIRDANGRAVFIPKAPRDINAWINMASGKRQPHLTLECIRDIA